ncbi:MAG: hypothetical protein E6J03_03330 [Chloroflexi bacterium]|nr:MAG: hypothetical protein E6J03_03330 [Chloroflexota bacterium]
MGHSTVAFTLATYGHVIPGMHETAAQRLANGQPFLAGPRQHPVGVAFRRTLASMKIVPTAACCSGFAGRMMAASAAPSGSASPNARARAALRYWMCSHPEATVS